MNVGSEVVGLFEKVRRGIRQGTSHVLKFRVELSLAIRGCIVMS
jgi:hypothetical protein